MSTIHGTTLRGPWKSALWGLVGLEVGAAADGQIVRTVRMPTMHAWPMVGAGWLAMAAVGVPQSWYSYCLIALVGLLLSEYAAARADLKESGASGASRWREAGTWMSFVVSVGYHAYQVVAIRDLAAVKPLCCALGLLALWMIMYVAHKLQRALRLIAEIGARLDTISEGTRLPDPEPEAPVRSHEIAVVVRLDSHRVRRRQQRFGRHRKAA